MKRQVNKTVNIDTMQNYNVVEMGGSVLDTVKDNLTVKLGYLN